MIYLVLIATIFFTVGLIYLLVNFGIQESLSRYYYCLKEKNLGYCFYLYLAITSFLLAPVLFQLFGAFGFFAAAGLLFVGASPAFEDDKTQHIVHSTGAGIAALMSIIILLKIHMIKYAFFVFIISLIFAGLTNTVEKSYVFWLEMIAFYSLFLGLLIFLI